MALLEPDDGFAYIGIEGLTAPLGLPEITGRHQAPAKRGDVGMLHAQAKLGIHRNHVPSASRGKILIEENCLFHRRNGSRGKYCSVGDNRSPRSRTGIEGFPPFALLQSTDTASILRLKWN